METTVKERLVRYLKYKQLGQNKFEKLAGISNGYIANLKKSPGATQLTKILNAAPDLNQHWLLTGEGSMLNQVNEVTPLSMEHRRGIPLVSQYAYGGYLTGYGDPEYMESLPIVDFTPDREMTGNWLAFEVRGDSMDDGSYESYRSGNIVICREVKPHLWKDSKLHIHRRDFVIVCEEGILIKRIIDHDVENHTIVIHSLNPDYQDRTINLAEVRQLFSIVESRRNCSR